MLQLDKGDILVNKLHLLLTIYVNRKLKITDMIMDLNSSMDHKLIEEKNYLIIAQINKLLLKPGTNSRVSKINIVSVD